VSHAGRPSHVLDRACACGKHDFDEEYREPTGGEAQRDAEPKLIQSSSDFVKGFVPPDYLIDGILQRRFFYTLTARTGAGKTALALLMAAFTALGRAIGNIEVTKGRVLYFAGENPDDVRMRWIAMAQNCDFDVDTIPVGFIPGTFKISQLAGRIAQEIEDRGEVAFVIVDTSAAYFEGDDENHNVQAGAHARQLRSLVNLPGGPCVLVLCHPVKNASSENLIPRGGGSFIAEVDGNLTANKDDSTVELHWQGKFRGPDFAPMAFLLRSVTHERLKTSRGKLIPTIIAEHLSETAQQDLSRTARHNEDKLLAEIANNGKASQSDYARACGWFLRNGDPHKTKVSRVQSQLKAAGLIRVERGEHVLTEKGEKAIKKARRAETADDE
jgi:AAA domain-containing protein